MKNLITLSIMISALALAKDYKALEKRCNASDTDACQEFDTDCKNKIGEACYIWGTNLVGKDDDSAIALFRAGCDAGYKKACKAVATVRNANADADKKRDNDRQIAENQEKILRYQEQQLQEYQAQQQQVRQVRSREEPINFAPLIPLINSFSGNAPQPRRTTTNCLWNPTYNTMQCTEE